MTVNDMDRIIKIPVSRRGFTLLELLIALVVLLLVLTLGFQLFFYVFGSYGKSEEDWIVQRDVRTVSDRLDKELQTAYILEIYASEPAAFAADDTFYYIYSEAGGIYLRKPKETSGNLIAGSTIAVKYSFDDIGSPNALQYELTGRDLKTNTETVYAVRGTVLILNLSPGRRINDSAPSGTVGANGTCIKYKTTADGIKGMIDSK